MTPSPSTEGKLAHDYADEILEAVRLANQPYPHTEWKEKYGSDVLGDVVVAIVQKAISTPSQPVGGNEGIAIDIVKTAFSGEYVGTTIQNFIAEKIKEVLSAKDAEKAVVQAMLDGTEIAAEKLKKERDDFQTQAGGYKKHLFELRVVNEAMRRGLESLLHEFQDIRLYVSQWEYKYKEDWDSAELRAKNTLKQYGGGVV